MARSIIARLLDRTRDPKRLTDMAKLVKAKPFPPATDAAVAKAERALGFALPMLLRQVYTQVGNGGFGPAYGLIGIPGGATDDLGRSIVDLYRDYRGDCPDTWPEKLLPVCHAGCAHYFCLDCSRKAVPVLSFDTTAHLVDEKPWRKSVRRVAPSFRRWLSLWLDHTEGRRLTRRRT
jgi:SMI1 / KNR4 family (SUKH-1)